MLNKKLKDKEKNFIKDILIGFFESHTNVDGIAPGGFEDIDTIEEVAICKGILQKLNAITL